MTDLNNNIFSNPDEEEETIITKNGSNGIEIKYSSKNVVILSSDRNLDKYPEPNDYKISLPEQFFDVTQLQLLEGLIPASQYNINSQNNILYLTETVNKVINNDSSVVRSDQFTDDKILKSFHYQQVGIKIPTGFYTPEIVNQSQQDKLALILTKELNKYGKNEYLVSYDEIKDKYKFQASPKDNNNIVYPYQFLFKGNEINYGEFSYDKIIKRDLNGNIVYDEHNQKVYETVYIGEKTHSYRNNAIGRILGYLNRNYNGLITGLVSSEMPKKIIGYNTSFKTDLEENQWITIVNTEVGIDPSYNSYQIDQIISNTELIIKDNIIIPFIKYELYSSLQTPPYLRSLNQSTTVALKIPKCRRLYSLNKVINSSFMLFEEQNFNLTTLWNDSNQVIVKNFNPPEGKLNELHIQFLNTNTGKLYDFGGKDHRLVFSITSMKQSRKYYNT